MFEDSDLDKLAFWMATGSGKTLLMHLNYHQFLHYNCEPMDNILLITPNEGLSAQHIEEMQHSGIPTARFDLNESGMLFELSRRCKGHRDHQACDGEAWRGRECRGGSV